MDILGDWGWILGLVLGLGLGWAIGALRAKADRLQKSEAQEALEKALAASEQEKAALQERGRSLESSLDEAKQSVAHQREEAIDLHRSLAGEKERGRSLEQRLEEQKKELAEMQKRLTSEFEVLANRALEANSEKFVARNKESLDKLLMPLAEKIGSFRERVEKSHDQGVKDRAELIEQLKTLKDLNQRMSEEARNLTTALKGESKTQGNWGELILERVLEKSGLEKGREYETQESLSGEDGRRYQPDVVINLPDQKHLVVDSKVSLVAYERWVNADDEAVRASALKEHLTSVRGHVGGLSKKRYDTLYGISSPDFTLMFIPVEPAFTVAMREDDALFDFAFQQNVVIVTPTTLLATLRTVANIWRQEKQTRNALEIAEKSGRLYDKFVGFVDDMNKIGDSIQKTATAHQEAMKKLGEGRGNLVNQVQALKELGAKAKKALPDEVVEDAREFALESPDRSED